eukprot:gb/GEZN01008494.1/.p1 GENE.gb/GEZN01008494.1/~~gb/GEZN01008494.1/.p1  ORF type:complete len:299 (+),score=20.70 gb/GEZN01008494.1/:204-1100(+)
MSGSLVEHMLSDMTLDSEGGEREVLGAHHHLGSHGRTANRGPFSGGAPNSKAAVSPMKAQIHHRVVLPENLDGNEHHHLGAYGRSTVGHGPFSGGAPHSQAKKGKVKRTGGNGPMEHLEDHHHLGSHGRSGGRAPFAGGAPHESPKKHEHLIPANLDGKEHHHLGNYGRSTTGHGPFSSGNSHQTPVKSSPQPNPSLLDTPEKDEDRNPVESHHHLGQYGRSAGHAPFAGGKNGNSVSTTPVKQPVHHVHHASVPADGLEHHHLGGFGRTGTRAPFSGGPPKSPGPNAKYQQVLDLPR